MVPVDILAYPVTHFEDLQMLPTLARKIARDGILLYEQR
jgi:hypothetical protein